MTQDQKEPIVSYVHMGGSTPLIGVPIHKFLRGIVRRFPDRDAVVSIPQDVRLSYADFDAETDRLAKGVMALGVKRGDRVGIWATDNVEWVLLQIATAKMGAVLVNVNPAYRPAELEHALNASQMSVLFLMPRFRYSHYEEMIRGLCPELETGDPDSLSCKRASHLRHVVIYDPENSAATERPAPGFLTWQEVLERGTAITDDELEERTLELEADDPINIQFTSGTTGFPKPVMLSHHNILNNAHAIGELLGFTEKDRLCVPLPFYHCFGMVVSNLGCLTRGAAIIIPSAHFEAHAALRAIESEKCTAIHGVPTMFVAELEELEAGDFDLSSLRTGIMAGAPCPPELMRKVMDVLGCKEILIGYGQTEASPVTHCTRRDDDFDTRVETVGTNLPYVEAKVVDPDTGANLAIDVQGEVCVRGYLVMRGYFGDEKATKEAIEPAGWLHTGDLGVIDKRGYLRITGRLKDMIIRGGENIYPAEIEAQLFEHPAVAEAAVFGIADERFGEEVVAWISLHEEESIDPEAVKAWLKERIAYFKIPRIVRIVDEFPMTVTGKIQKFKMREMMEKELQAV